MMKRYLTLAVAALAFSFAAGSAQAGGPANAVAGPWGIVFAGGTANTNDDNTSDCVVDTFCKNDYRVAGTGKLVIAYNNSVTGSIICNAPGFSFNGGGNTYSAQWISTVSGTVVPNGDGTGIIDLSVTNGDNFCGVSNFVDHGGLTLSYVVGSNGQLLFSSQLTSTDGPSIGLWQVFTGEGAKLTSTGR